MNNTTSTVHEIFQVLGPTVPDSVTDHGARYEWGRALEICRAALAQQPEAPSGEAVEYGTCSAMCAREEVCTGHCAPLAAPQRPNAENGDFDCPKAAASRACACGFCVAFRTLAQQPEVCGTCREAIRPDALTGTICKCAQQPEAPALGAVAVEFVNLGDSEAQFVADGEALNCPSCGGSGHAGDAPQPAIPEAGIADKVIGYLPALIDVGGEDYRQGYNDAVEVCAQQVRLAFAQPSRESAP